MIIDLNIGSSFLPTHVGKYRVSGPLVYFELLYILNLSFASGLSAPKVGEGRAGTIT